MTCPHGSTGPRMLSLLHLTPKHSFHALGSSFLRGDGYPSVISGTANSSSHQSHSEEMTEKRLEAERGVQSSVAKILT